MEVIREHKKEGVIGASAIMVMLFCFLLFMKLGLPDPPLSSLGDGGVELNYGIDEAGFGEIQNSTVQASEPMNTSSQQLTTPEPSEQALSEETPITSEDVESEPITIVKKLDQIKDLSQKDKVTKQVKSNTENSTSKVESNDNKTETAKNNGLGNNGDKPNTVGDQGDKNGNPDARALYGNPGEGNNPNGSGGTGGGAALDLAGWMWDSKPTPKDNTNESGRIVFQIKINAEGEIIAITAIEKTVSPALVQFYKAHVEKLTFSKINPTVTPSATTVGKITFIIKTR